MLNHAVPHSFTYSKHIKDGKSSVESEFWIKNQNNCNRVPGKDVGELPMGRFGKAKNLPFDSFFWLKRFYPIPLPIIFGR
jgi:hypothetical protein